MKSLFVYCHLLLAMTYSKHSRRERCGRINRNQVFTDGCQVSISSIQFQWQEDDKLVYSSQVVYSGIS